MMWISFTSGIASLVMCAVTMFVKGRAVRGSMTSVTVRRKSESSHWCYRVKIEVVPLEEQILVEYIETFDGFFLIKDNKLQKKLSVNATLYPGGSSYVLECKFLPNQYEKQKIGLISTSIRGETTMNYKCYFSLVDSLK